VSDTGIKAGSAPPSPSIGLSSAVRTPPPIPYEGSSQGSRPAPPIPDGYIPRSPDTKLHSSSASRGPPPNPRLLNDSDSLPMAESVDTISHAHHMKKTYSHILKVNKSHAIQGVLMCDCNFTAVVDVFCVRGSCG